MKPNSTSYLLRLVRTGIYGYLGVILFLVIYQATSGGAMEFYDLSLLFVTGGSVIAVMGFVIFFSNAIPKLQIRRFLAHHSKDATVRDFPADNLPALSIAAVLVAISGLVWIKVMNANGIRQPIPGNYPRVGSINLELEEFKTLALNWRPDAYLARATFELADDSPSRISATYNSDMTPQDQLVIELRSDGSVTRKTYRVPSTTSSGRERAILDSDWQLDSEDALRIFATKEEVSACLMAYPQHRNRLELNRWEIAGRPRVVWILILPECFDAQFHRIAIDASTGEWLDITQ